jgi:hypothetical protein
MPNGNGVSIPSWVTFLGTLVLTVGASFGTMYSTFETRTDHQTDQQRNEEMLREIRQDIKTLLQRVPGTAVTFPRYRPPFPEEGYEAPPRPPMRALDRDSGLGVWHPPTMG